MEQFKLKHFADNHPGVESPRFRTLSANETKDVSGRLLAALELPAESVNALPNLIRKSARPLSGLSALDHDFDLCTAMESEGVRSSEDLYVNWDDFTTIDLFVKDDLCTYFGDIWYPSSDDIEIFDNTFRWIIQIDHDGGVSVHTC